VTQFNQVGYQKLWGLITGDLPGTVRRLLILVAYLLYPIVIVVFGFFYIFYGSILYIFGPIVIALMPLGAANRIAKAYVENIFIWNAWPILYGGFGALLSAVQMGQIGQMLSQNNFLGGLGNLEGSILIGIVSIVYSLAIAVIPFIAKRIVSGDVGSTAVAMVGTAVTALTAGAAGFEGAAAGVAASRAEFRRRSLRRGSAGTATAGARERSHRRREGNQPAPPQQAPIAASSAAKRTSRSATAFRHLKGHAEQIRSSISDVMGADEPSDENSGAISVPDAGFRGLTGSVQRRKSEIRTINKSAAPMRRGPTVHRYNLGTWTAYHAARIAAKSVVSATSHKE
jgi:hypothetical protein